MERNISLNPPWLKCLSFAHFTKICNHVNPLLGQLSEPGPCSCKNSKSELCQIPGEFASESEGGIQATVKVQETGGGRVAHWFTYLYSDLVPQQMQDGWVNGDTAIQRVGKGPEYPGKSELPPYSWRKQALLIYQR